MKEAQALTQQPANTQDHIYFEGKGWYHLPSMSKRQFKKLLKTSKKVTYQGFECKAKFIKKNFKALLNVLIFTESVE